ncbi:translation initiation factor 2 [Pseudohalocynthiibacter aestuariivivens]|nr:translation initiation factor 2 [Pseudohalocynthiibacter aestuariivivens]QIE46916.1 translation initiation factor 2 [Pseudohalocynthiibacter aestuariivivens]
MPRFVVSAALTCATLSLSACATVTRGNSEDVVFTSEPTGAQMTTSMGVGCTTPCTIDIKRRKAFSAVFQQGGETRTIAVASKIGGGGVATGAANVIAGGVVGIAVDASTGATLEHMPNPVHADFSKPQSQAQVIAEAHAKKIMQAKAKATAEANKAKNPGQGPTS